MERRANTQHIVLILALLTPADTIHFQVSHHPPAAAHHVTSQRGWTLWQHITIDSKFRGKYISVVPLGKKQSECSRWQSLYMSTNATTSEIWFINTRKCLCDVLYAFLFYHRKHSPAVPLEWKPLCVEQSDFHSAQYYCREALDWSGVFLLDSSSQSFLKVLYIFSLCISFFLIHLWTSLRSLSCSEEYFLCLFVYFVKMDLWITPG